MIKTLIEQLEKKGIANARAVIEELARGGALTDFEASKYVGAEEVMVLLSKDATSTSAIIADVAYRYSIGSSTLRRALGCEC